MPHKRFEGVIFTSREAFPVYDTRNANVVVYCYPHQREFIEKNLSKKVKIREVSLDVAEVVLGVQEDEFKIYEVERELNEE